MAHPHEPSATTWIGRPLRRREDPPLLSGRGQFVDDVAPPGLLHLAVVRSPHAHARVLGVDVEAARAALGVVDVVVGAETAHLTHFSYMAVIPEMLKPIHPLLATDRVRFVGQEVVGILAESAAAARDAADLVEVEYEPLQAVVLAEDAAAPDAPLLHGDLGTNVAFRRAFGSPREEVDATLTQADHVVQLRLTIPRVAPVAIEPRTVVAAYDDEAGLLRVWANTQRPSSTRDDIADTLGLPRERVHVLAPHVGGSFGAKGNAYRDEMLACYLAWKHRRAVRFTATRGEDLLTTQHGRDMVYAARAGFSRDGELQVMDVTLHAAIGAYAQSTAAVPPMRASRIFCGPYRVRVARGEAVAVFTNAAPAGPYRGAGRPEAALLAERVMDTAARELGIDPVALRRRNFIPADAFPWTTPTGSVYDSGDHQRTLDVALDLAGYGTLLRERDAIRAAGGLAGVGLATFTEPSGGIGFETARVTVQSDGSVIAASGSFAHGQGHATTFAQVVADHLGVNPEHVHLLQGDTLRAPDGMGTFGSRSTAVGGSALALAAQRVRERMRAVAAHLLEAQLEDVVVTESGAFGVVGVPERVIPFAEVAAAAHDPTRLPPGENPGLEADERFDTRSEMWAVGAHVAAVSVDRETGRVTLRRYVAVDDAGVLVNPLLAEGQVHGGLAQGIGQALMEWARYDETGALLAGSLGDYAVPRASDVPTFVLGETVTPTPLNPLGAKGVGEGGAVGAPPAIINAVVDALAPLGITSLDPPLTSERIWQALRHAGAI